MTPLFRFPRPSAARNRILSALVVLTYLGATRAIVPDEADRATFHSVVVLTIGYGHLLGAYLGSSRQPTRRSHVFPLALGWGSVLIAFVIFSGWGVTRLPLVLGLLAVATWHTAENDRALGSAYANGGRMAALSRSIDEHVAALGTTSILIAIAAATLTDFPPAGARVAGATYDYVAWVLRGLTLLAGAWLLFRASPTHSESLGLALIAASALVESSLLEHLPPLTFADFFAATTSYHLVSWIVLSLDRRTLSGRRPTKLLVVAHAVPTATACTLFAWPGESLVEWQAAFFAPGPYLFWSVAHVIQTAVHRSRSLRGDASLA